MAAVAYSVSLPERADPDDRTFVQARLQRQPDHIAAALAERYDRTQHDKGRRAANLQLLDYDEQHSDRTLPPDASEDQIRSWADSRAKAANDIKMLSKGDEGTLYEELQTFVQAFRLKAPEPKGQRTYESCILRMCNPKWWRRQARSTYLRTAEAQARELGLVRLQRGLYVSDDAYKAFLQRARKNAETLANTLAINTTTGEELALAEVMSHTVAEPAIRRGEMIVRIRGMEETAKNDGQVALFVTITTPSAYHAYHKNGRPNPKFQGHSPRAGQACLSKVWQRIRAKAHREGILWHGLRIAEPHHDGTPHWHLIVFVPRGQAAKLRLIFEDYATREDKAELAGETWKRCKVIPIDPRKGSAAGYAAKYVSKNIDGYALNGVLLRDADNETSEHTLDPTDTAARVRAWASTWGIRQFQFFGTPPVSVWRELRRLGLITDNVIAEALRQAADTCDWSRFMELMGGPAASREDHPMRLVWRADTNSRKGEYGEPIARPVLLCSGQEYHTRTDEWEIIYQPAFDDFPTLRDLREGDIEALLAGGEADRPWTCVNNCTKGIVEWYYPDCEHRRIVFSDP